MSLTRPLTRSLTRSLTRPLVGHKYAQGNFLDRFSTNLVYALAMDSRIGSKRGVVVESHGTYINPCICAFRSDGAIKSFPQSGLKAALEAWGEGTYSATAWAYDLSANGNDAVQATLAAQPTIMTAGVVNLDALGNLALKPDGVDDFLECASPLITADHTGAYSVYAVFDNTGADSGYLYSADLAPNGVASYFSGTTLCLSDDGSSGTLGDSVTAAAGVNLLRFEYNNNSVSVAINGTEGSNAYTYDFEAPVDGMILFNRRSGGSAATFLAGNLTCLLIYNADMSAQRPAIEAELARIYGVTLA